MVIFDITWYPGHVISNMTYVLSFGVCIFDSTWHAKSCIIEYRHVKSKIQIFDFSCNWSPPWSYWEHLREAGGQLYLLPGTAWRRSRIPCGIGPQQPHLGISVGQGRTPLPLTLWSPVPLPGWHFQRPFSWELQNTCVRWLENRGGWPFL